jgi:hypothetical protein
MVRIIFCDLKIHNFVDLLSKILMQDKVVDFAELCSFCDLLQSKVIRNSFISTLEQVSLSQMTNLSSDQNCS